MDDEKIVNLLFDRSENALDELSRKYSRLYKGILRETVGNEFDTEECANDVLLAVWNSIPPNRPTSLPAYVCKIARRIGIDRFRYNMREKRCSDCTLPLSEFEDCLPDRETDCDDRDSDETLKSVLSDFLRSLDTENRILFLRRYFYLESVASLAERFCLSENHVSVKLYRARKKLKKMLEKEGVSI
ncbi:MAG: RNA polymerase sigma factor [Eubacteriales bacterium]